MKSKVWKLKRITEGIPNVDDFELTEEDVPPCTKDGDVITEAVVISTEPYTAYDPTFTEGYISTDKAYYSAQVAKVIESRNKKFPVGTYIHTYKGWREKTHITKEDLDGELDWVLGPAYQVPDTGKHPISTTVHALGMTGLVAYFGVTKILEPQPGDICFVNGTAGSIGSTAAQILKALGCKVIGCAGSDIKVEWLKSLGIDYVFNYKTEKLADALKKYAPSGINCYYDNLGGNFTKEVLKHMKRGGKMVAGGAIDSGNNKGSEPCISSQDLLWNELKVQGFIMTTYFDDYPKAFTMIKQWMDQGHLKSLETSFKGFEKLPEAFAEQFKGNLSGKCIVNL